MPKRPVHRVFHTQHVGRCSPGQGFTLIELLVVVTIIALLIGILLPSLASARRAAITTQDLSNMRQMQIASAVYTNARRGELIDVGLPHGGAHSFEESAWIQTLEDFYGHDLIHRSPLDDSPHWSIEKDGEGMPLPGADLTDEFPFRRTSYGVNTYLTEVAGTIEAVDQNYRRITQIKRPHAVVQFLHIAYTGDFAGSDHPHVENWFVPSLPGISPTLAANQMELDAAENPRDRKGRYSGYAGQSQRQAFSLATEPSLDSKSPYSFMDGHAEVLPFRGVYEIETDQSQWKFINGYRVDPETAFRVNRFHPDLAF